MIAQSVRSVLRLRLVETRLASIMTCIEARFGGNRRSFFRDTGRDIAASVSILFNRLELELRKRS